MKPIKKVRIVGGCIEIYPDKLVIQEGTFSKKTTTLAYGEIKSVSNLFDRLQIETSAKGKLSLWFGNDNLGAFMALKAVKGAMKDAGY